MIAPAPIIAARSSSGSFIPQIEADARIASWKAEALRIGREEDRSQLVILSFFDRTGAWSQPYVDAGYSVLRYDITTGQDLVGFFPNGDIIELQEAGFKIKGVLAAPPCTSFAVSGARWWKDQHDQPSKEWLARKYGDTRTTTEYFNSPLEYAQCLVYVTEALVELANPDFHSMENPVGRMARVCGLPRPLLTFEPHHYGSPYTKRTQLWGNFNPALPTANVEPHLGSMMHRLRGDVPAQKARRSETPEGFAYAFFMANQ